MAKVWICVYLLASSVIAALVAAFFCASLLELYPAAQLRTSVPRLPAATEMALPMLQGAPSSLGVLAALTVLVAIVLWRRPWSRDTRCFAVAATAGVSLSLTASVPLLIMVHWFYLPKLLNSAASFGG